MALSRLVVLFPLFVLVSGCLQIELLGPVTGASVTISELRSGLPVITGLTTENEASLRATHGDTKWDEWREDIRLQFLGTVEIPEDALRDGTLYLVTAAGGTDVDNNLDGVIDASGAPVSRALHAIMTGAQLKEPINRVSLLSEATYQALVAGIPDMSDAELLAQLDKTGRSLVGDVNGDGSADYADVLAWSRSMDDFPYKGPEIFLDRLPRAIQSRFFTDEIVLIDSLNVVDAVRWRPARAQGEWNDVLVGCAGAVVLADLCRFSVLPLIGQSTTGVTVEDVMERVVVSHFWMKRRFEELLRAMPRDMLLLFRSVTSIVIDANIRPAFYSLSTASIYIDPFYIWVKDGENRTISQAPDYREEFASQVAFASLARLVQNNRYAFDSIFEQDANGDRKLDDVVALASSLLFHELAHAGDGFPPKRLGLLSMADTPYDAGRPWISTQLSAISPLQSTALFGIADVLFAGKQATPIEATYSASRIGEFFAPDAASDLYAYSSQWEDAAMLFEEAMMAIHFDVQRDIAFTTVPPSNVTDPVCADFRVGWGSRGRITARQVLPRINLVLEELLPEREYASILASAPAPKAFDTGKDWCDNLFQPVSASKFGAGPGAPAARGKNPLRQLPHYR